MKKIISLILSFVIVMAICVPAFADEAAYDYTKDERINAVSDYENGEFVWGGYSPAMYQIINKKMYTLKDLPTYFDEEANITYTLGDSTTNLPEFEGVSIVAYYAFNCPKCGKANGCTRLSSIYGGVLQGTCMHCGELLPDPSTMKIYRFITIAEDSAHYDVLSSYDLARYSDDIYGATEKDYGDGKDLPQYYLEWKTDEEGNIVTDAGGARVLESFRTKGLNKAEFKTKFMAGLYVFLVDFQYKVTPSAQRFSASKYTAFVYQLRLKIVDLWEKMLTGIATN